MAEILNGFACPCLHSSFWNLMWHDDICVVWIGDALLGFPKGESYVGNPLHCDHIHHIPPNVGAMPGYVAMFLALETSIIIICHHVDCRWCSDGSSQLFTPLSFSTYDMASLGVCGPFSYMQVAKLCVFFKPLINILIVATSLVKLHLLAAVLNWCIYTARDSFYHCWISKKCEVYVGMSTLQSLSLSRSFISSHDLFEKIACMTSVCVKPCDFALASLALLLLVILMLFQCQGAKPPTWWNHIH